MSRYIDYDAINYRHDKIYDKSDEFLNGVVCVDDGKHFPSYADAGLYYGISPKTVKSCCERMSQGRKRTFRYADDFCSYGSRSEKPNNSKVSEKPTGSERSE